MKVNNITTNLFEVPILFIIFNRPETTFKVFSQIKRIRPRHLYVISDGPRTEIEDDREKVLASRKIVDDIDWDCAVHKNYSDTNLGCRERVASGIDWFFKNVEAGIILEDDCFPSLSFFNYCSELLHKYIDTEKIMMISGHNFRDSIPDSKYSYHFSKYSQIWGWATWKRAWSKYDVNMKDFPAFKHDKLINKIITNKKIRRHWIKHLNIFYKTKANSWDIQWAFALFQNNGLCIVPNNNMISNIGFGDDATHCKDGNDYPEDRKVTEVDSIIHPPYIDIDKDSDEYEERRLLATIERDKNEMGIYNHLKYEFLNSHPSIHKILKIIKAKLLGKYRRNKINC